MMNAKRLIIATVVMSLYNTDIIAMDDKTAPIDIRQFGLQFEHNNQDADKNTFWHLLAIECAGYTDWSEVEQKKTTFKNDNNNWLPNPLIKNKNNKTARQEAKASYNKSGNAVCGLLVYHLADIERGYFNQLALRENQALMLLVQQGKYPESLNTKK